jgi:hypothetical protein
MMGAGREGGALDPPNVLKMLKLGMLVKDLTAKTMELYIVVRG